MAPKARKKKVYELMAPQPGVVPQQIGPSSKTQQHFTPSPRPLPSSMECVPPVGLSCAPSLPVRPERQSCAPSLPGRPERQSRAPSPQVTPEELSCAPSLPVRPERQSRPPSLPLRPEQQSCAPSLPVIPEGLSSAPSSPVISTSSIVAKTRGHFTTNQTQHEVAVKRKGRKHPLIWDSELMCGVRSDDHNDTRVANEIGFFIRQHVDCLKESFNDLLPNQKQIVFDQLSVLYDYDQQHSKLRPWILEKSRVRYKCWRFICRKQFKEKGVNNPPVQIGNRLQMWRELFASFGTPKQIKKSKDMVDARKELTVFHTSGPRTFISHAQAHRANGSVAPHLEAYIDVYKTNNKKVTEELEARVTELAATMELQHTSGTSSSQPVSATFETQVQILEDIVGVTYGTRIPGMGSLSMRDPKSKRKRAVNLNDSANIELIQTLQHKIDDLEQQNARRDQQNAKRDRQFQKMMEYMHLTPGFTSPIQSEDEDEHEGDEDDLDS